jgi:hypothetical protein
MALLQIDQAFERFRIVDVNVPLIDGHQPVVSKFLPVSCEGPGPIAKIPAHEVAAPD